MGKSFEEFTFLPKKILGIKTHSNKGYAMLGVCFLVAFVVFYKCLLLLNKSTNSFIGVDVLLGTFFDEMDEKHETYWADLKKKAEE